SGVDQLFKCVVHDRTSLAEVEANAQPIPIAVQFVSLLVHVIDPREGRICVDRVSKQRERDLVGRREPNISAIRVVTGRDRTALVAGEDGAWLVDLIATPGDVFVAHVQSDRWKSVRITSELPCTSRTGNA